VDVEDPQAGALARVAWTIASGTAVAVARSALQVFGGYGFTLEYPVHLYYRASKALEVSLPGELRARTADFRVLSRPAFTAVGGPAG
jgi:alkylation response protein AidB-like acyl-CoA dehydrogenase